MKQIIFFFSLLFFSSISFGQFYTKAQISTIHTTKAAYEGDMYLDTLNKNYYIGLTTGELTIIDFLDSVKFENDSLKIFQGDSLFSTKITTGAGIDSMKYENDTLKLYTTDSLFEVKIVPDFLINGLDNSTVYYINNSSGGGASSSDTGCGNTITIKRLLENESHYGFQGQAFIGCDDNIWVCGDANSTSTPAPFGHPNTGSDAIRPFILPEDPYSERKGAWKYVWATRFAIWALTDSGEVYRKGDATSGTLGNNSTTVDLHYLTKMDFFETLSSKVTYLYPPSFNYSSIAYGTVFALMDDGDVYSWGENQYGQIGNSINTTDQLTPYKITALDAPFIVKMSVGDARYTSVYAIDNANNLYSWGYNVSGGLANGSNSGNINTPTIIPGIKASDVKSAGFRSFVRIITTDSNTMAAGENADRQIGDNTNGDKNTFTDIFYNSSTDSMRNNIAEVAVWNYNSNGGSIAVTYDRELWVCGGNIDRQQGIGNVTVDQGIFVKPTAEFQGMVKKAIYIGAYNGYTSIAVLDTLGRIWTCGDNTRGQLGNGTVGTTTIGLFTLVVTDINSKAKFVDIKSFGRTTVPGFSALTEDGKVVSCGSDSQGQVGVGDYPVGNINFLKRLKFEP